MFDPFTLLAALIPVVGTVVTRATDRFWPAPKTTQELTELEKAYAEKLKALAALDNSEGASRWVLNIKNLQRPIVIFLIVSTWCFIAVKYGMKPEDLENMASAAMFYLFGDRTHMYALNRKQ
jgi:hypothetical protein